MNEKYGYSEYFYLNDADRVYYSNLQKQIMESNLLEKKKSDLINFFPILEFDEEKGDMSIATADCLYYSIELKVIGS